jgi:hypothetical protein
MRLKIYKKRVEAQALDDKVEFWINQPTPFNASLVLFGLQLKNEDDSIIFSIYNFHHFAGASTIAPYLIYLLATSDKENNPKTWESLLGLLKENQ